MSQRFVRVTFLSPNASACSIYAAFGRLKFFTLALAALLAALALSDTAFARKRRHRGHKSSAAAAAARKKQAVRSIRAQIAAAQQALAAAESAGGVAHVQLEEMRTRVSRAREAMAQAVDEEREARQDLQDLEEEILEGQSPESEFGRAQARLAVARRVAEEIRAPYRGNWAGLNTDGNYLAGVEELRAAKREYDRTRAALLSKNPDWQYASQELREMLAQHREERKGGGGSLSMMTASRNLRSAQEIAAAARQVIATGEARLRQLGEKVPSSTQRR
jgi:hypothetical protein